MMKHSLLIGLAILMSCGGSLSDEQRKEMRNKMEENQIVRVTEVEITEAAFAEGRRIVKTLDSLGDDSAKINRFTQNEAGTIRFVRPGVSNAKALEQQLIEAYLSDESGSWEDNVQEVRNSGGDFDSLLYTKPVTRLLPDGSEQLEGVWNIWFPKKNLVVKISRNK